MPSINSRTRYPTPGDHADHFQIFACGDGVDVQGAGQHRAGNPFPPRVPKLAELPQICRQTFQCRNAVGLFRRHAFSLLSGKHYRREEKNASAF